MYATAEAWLPQG